MKKFFLLFILLFSRVYVGAQTPIAIDSALTTRHGPEKGSLVIIGGGEIGDEIWEKCIALAGGKDSAFFVIVTNATPEDASQYVTGFIAGFEKRLDKKRVGVLNLKTIREANDEKNLQELKKATGVFFIGGRQWRISEVYLNTLAHVEFQNVLARGGVIAGTSAGASIQGSFLWRGDTKSHQILIGDHVQGLGFLRNSAIDQHILVRNRQAHLSEFVKIAPHFIGIGIDESTAVVVTRDNVEVIGKSYAAIHDANSLPFFFLKQGQKYDLKERKIILREQLIKIQNK
ncbi:MAG: cyanophycinase [Dysgonamonadaceae bacterium]|jgi:cyanophycinase|nr:cyanophycinase [Dysgonamonadaceae bacterium]